MTAGSWENELTGFSWERRYRWQVSKETQLGVFGEDRSRKPLQPQAITAARFWGEDKRGCALSQHPPPNEPQDNE